MTMQTAETGDPSERPSDAAPDADDEVAGGTPVGADHPKVRRSVASRFSALNVSVMEVLLTCSFAWSAWRNKWLSDDGYIYLAYVRNLTENGWGPVFNRGERVEGFTSPAWYTLLSLMNLARPDSWLDMRQAVLIVSLVLSIAAVAMWVPVETMAARLGERYAGDELDAALPRSPLMRRQTRLNIPLAVMAAWYPLHSFATSGLETPLQLLVLMTLIVYVWSDADHDWMVGALAGLLPLVRPELGVLSVLLIGRHVFRVRRWQSIATVLALFALPLVASLVVRVSIYGQLLPNTFYTKTDAGHGMGSGLEYVRDTSAAYGLHWVAAAAVLVVIVPRVSSNESAGRALSGPRSWFLGAALAMTSYVVVVGGDFMHARFLLTSGLLLMAVFAGLGSDAISMFDRDLRRRIVMASIATLILFAAAQYSEPVQRTITADEAERARLNGDISDEELSYFHRNRALHAWNPSTVDPWVSRGAATRGLSEVLDTEIGVTSGGIGHLAFTGQATGGRVYVYDLLGLTRLDIARLDMQGPARRVGHAKRAPNVLIASNPRVDFHSPYFQGWADIAAVNFDGQRFIIMNLDLIDPMVENGVMPASDAERLRAWILDRLSGQRIDRNFVTFLTMRYHRDDEILARVRELADLDRTSAWRAWLDDTERERRLLDTSGCFATGTVDCWGRAIDRHRAAPILSPTEEPDIVDVAGRDI